MSLETVVEDIREEAEAEAAEIAADADAEATELVEAAEQEANETVEAAERDVEDQIEREREQRLSSAALEAKQERLGARRDLLEDVHEAVTDRIADLPRDRRAELTRALLDASEDEFDEGPVSVFGRAEDEDVLEEVLADYEDFEFGGTVDCLGGVILESDASRVRINNTFDAILEGVWEDNLKAISDRLFEQ